MAALKHFYHNLGDKLWGPFGFKDAFNLKLNWFAGSYIAIDQGPIIVMIENYRTGLLWENFMANPEIQPMLNTIGFVPDSTTAIDEDITSQPINFTLIGNYPNPFNASTVIKFYLPKSDMVNIIIYNIQGKKVKEITNRKFSMGINEIRWDGTNENNISVSSAIYIYKLETSHNMVKGKMLLYK